MRFRLLLGLALAATILAGCGSSGSGDAAATVNGRSISMSAFNAQVQLKRSDMVYETQGIDVCAIKGYASLCKQLKQTALSELIATALEQQYADKHGIKVTNTDVQVRWRQVVHAKFHDQNDVARAYAKRIGVNVPVLQDQIRRQVLEERVMGRLTAHMVPYTPAIEISRITLQNGLQYAELNQQLADKKLSFNQIVKRMSKNNSACKRPQACGDLGWIPVALLSSKDTALKTARAGTLLPPTTEQQLISLTRVNARTNRYFMTDQQTLAMRQRYLTQWLQKQERTATVKKYVAV